MESRSSANGFRAMLSDTFWNRHLRTKSTQEPLRTDSSQDRSSLTAPKVSVVDTPNKLNMAFNYRDLDTTRHQIRTVTIHPADGRTSPLTCSLESVYLEDRPEYEALSYTWASTDNPISITIDNQNFLVSRSLHETMINLRLLHDPRTL